MTLQTPSQSRVANSNLKHSAVRHHYLPAKGPRTEHSNCAKTSPCFYTRLMFNCALFLSR